MATEECKAAAVATTISNSIAVMEISTKAEVARPCANKGAAADSEGFVGPCKVRLIPEYGVIHLRGALSEAGQRHLWGITKPFVKDPKGYGAGFSGFSISEKRSTKPRNSDFDRYGHLLFHLCAMKLVAKQDGLDLSSEPSYKHLADIATGAVPVMLDNIQGNYYRADAGLMNHCDSDDILCTMSVALGDDCEFAIGKRTGRPRATSERHGKVHTIRMRSGDAIFFDGGSVPHQVKRIIKGTAPSWWGKAKVPNGSRCVVLFREREKSRNGQFCAADNRRRTKKKKKKKKKLGGKAKVVTTDTTMDSKQKE